MSNPATGANTPVERRVCIHGGTPWYCLKCENARLKEHLTKLVACYGYMHQFVPDDDKKKRIAVLFNEAKVELAEDI